MRGSWKSEEPLLFVLLLITTIGLNLLQYTMSDQFSFSLAIVPELVGLYLLGSPAALLLILATVLTNTIYRIAAGTLKPLAAGGRVNHPLAGGLRRGGRQPLPQVFGESDTEILPVCPVANILDRVGQPQHHGLPHTLTQPLEETHLADLPRLRPCGPPAALAGIRAHAEYRPSSGRGLSRPPATALFR